LLGGQPFFNSDLWWVPSGALKFLLYDPRLYLGLWFRTCSTYLHTQNLYKWQNTIEFRAFQSCFFLFCSLVVPYVVGLYEMARPKERAQRSFLSVPLLSCLSWPVQRVCVWLCCMTINRNFILWVLNFVRLSVYLTLFCTSCRGRGTTSAMTSLPLNCSCVLRLLFRYAVHIVWFAH